MSFIVNPYIYAAPSFVNDYSMLLDGVNESIQVSDDATLDITDKLSLFCWVKTTDTLAHIISKSSSTNMAYRLVLENSGKLRAQVSTDGSFAVGTAKNYEYNTAINDDAWHFVGCTFDGGTFKVYVDGSDVTASCTKYADASFTTIYANTSILYFGANQTGNFYSGYIDEASIWDTTVLSSGDVSTLYNSGVPTDLSSYGGSANLVSWWRMGDGATWGGSSWSIPDEIGSNTATSVNMEEADRGSTVPS